MGRRRSEMDDDGIAAECEAFLAGRSAALLDRHRQPVPTWAWVNVLAHADYERLVDVAAGDRHKWRRRQSRDAAVLLQSLAADLLRECAVTGVTLRRLQWERLIPLELALARRPAVLPDDELTRLVMGVGETPRPISDRYPEPAVGRNMGHGRFNRALLMVLGPASITSRR